MLRIASPWVNPMSWLLAGGAVFVARGKVSLGLWGLIAGLIVAAFAISAIPWRMRGGAWRAVPQFPGPLNHLVRKNLREMLATLDFYCALLLSILALAFRAWGKLPEEAMLPMTALAAKDAAYLALAIPLALTLAPLAGASAALISLAVGHHATVKLQKPQTRWRFSAGAPLMEGLAQAALIAMAASAVSHSAWFAPVCVLVWAASLWWYGRAWEQAE
jgi:hypothetical protein